MNRSIVRYHGGKTKVAAKIIQHFPPHRIYVEPFGGGASVLMAKPRSYSEVYSDTNSDIVNVMRVLRDPQLAQQLRTACELTPYSREEFLQPINRSQQVEWARGVIFRSFAGFGSGGGTEASPTGFRSDTKRPSTTPAHDWASWPSHIVDFVARLRGVVIENRDAQTVMSMHDTPETLHYCDPPYMASTRFANKKKVYGAHEMTDTQHEDLLLFLSTLKGKVAISGYRSDLYDTALANWRRVDFNAQTTSNRGATESLWMNYGHLTLFS